MPSAASHDGQMQILLITGCSGFIQRLAERRQVLEQGIAQQAFSLPSRGRSGDHLRDLTDPCLSPAVLNGLEDRGKPDFASHA